MISTQTSPSPDPSRDDGHPDEWTTDSEDTEVVTPGDNDRNPLIDGRHPHTANPQTRHLLKQEKKEKKKVRNKKIRKRIRRVFRTSWKWFRRGCIGLAPTVAGIGLAFGPVIRPESNSATGYSVYGGRA
ncbi:uncharacterized protein LOC124286159 [Haliotis rubra]|uniref:uncharacterized protein LOC124286159 n=1 Tax=Haliotis rubra TaxID=36100 RepID=UPI001EE56A3F|nr:uncharacterized protein LOC124286159 [Haliotis rubra]